MWYIRGESHPQLTYTYTQNGSLTRTPDNIFRDFQYRLRVYLWVMFRIVCICVRVKFAWKPKAIQANCVSVATTILWIGEENNNIISNKKKNVSGWGSCPGSVKWRESALVETKEIQWLLIGLENIPPRQHVATTVLPILFAELSLVLFTNCLLILPLPVAIRESRWKNRFIFL